jgi:hypothetical protein
VAIAGVILLANGVFDRMRIPTRSAQALASAGVFGVVILATASMAPGAGSGNEPGGHVVVAADDHHDTDLAAAETDGHAHGDDAAHDDGDDAHGHNDDGAVHAAGGNHDTSDGSHGHTGSTSDNHAHTVSSQGNHSDDGHGHTGGNGVTTGTTHGGDGHNHGSGGNGSTPTTHDHGGGGSTPTTHDHGGGGTPTWEETRLAALMGGLSGAALDEKLSDIAAHLTVEIRNRSNALRRLPEAEAAARIKTYVDWTIAHTLEGEHGVGNHQHGPEVWQTMDPATTATLNSQLATAKSILPNYPTAQDAMNAGYFQVTPWAPGIGAHYLNVAYVFSFDPAHPAMLLYAGNKPSSVLVGVSYAVVNNGDAPAGFAGPNDHWHTHPQLCLIGAYVVGADNVPTDLCESIGGSKGNGFGAGSNLHMMHLWQVPGWSSDWGLMSGENPKINLKNNDI